ncbi:MAG TPA: chromosome partitioning protein [Rhodocyclaceae bacterium]|nr:MAG: chromosome partitioning protein [Rhodocyclales bacterium CG_4_10_14_3_um_filter_68_10]PJA56240.1 MAG: chromosome partitioning protein [Rhodocyclales bacterium CG_4_9_14_3_um_filter_68_10]HCX32622.1 chromosome partitioning protein [Rhodocyclaceae bacterium]
MISIAFFNNKGGVGKTSLVYHTAWMFAELGHRVLAVDLDPQSNLSIMALDEERLEALWPDDEHPQTLHGAVAPLFGGTGDIRPGHIEAMAGKLGLLVGDLALSRIEDDLSTEWPRCLEGRERAFRVTTAFWRVIREAAQRHAADLVLIDVGPNLGAINRAALVASSHVVVPVAPDLFSLQGLKNLGPTLRQWRQTWQQALPKASTTLGEMPQGQMAPVGYVLMQHAERLGRPTKAYAKWQARLPGGYQESVLGEQRMVTTPDVNQIHRIKHYRSLMPMAMEARKPMFDLTSADGAIGAHQTNVQRCHDDFEALCREIARRVGCEQ